MLKVHLCEPDEARITAGYHVLGHEERRQAHGFLNKSDRILFLQGRIHRRQIIGHYLGASPSSLAFTRERFGKPAVILSGDVPLSFNTSHCDGLTAVAVALNTNIPIGVDVERLDRSVPEALWQRCLSLNELNWIASLTPSLRMAQFMRLWTCKEAIMKATGLGLRIDPSQIELDSADFNVCSAPSELGDVHQYHVVHRTVLRTFSLSVCIIGEKPNEDELEVIVDGS